MFTCIQTRVHACIHMWVHASVHSHMWVRTCVCTNTVHVSLFNITCGCALMHVDTCECMIMYTDSQVTTCVCSHRWYMVGSVPTCAYMSPPSLLPPPCFLGPSSGHSGRLNHWFLSVPTHLSCLAGGALFLTCNSCSWPLLPCPRPCPCPSHCAAHRFVPPNETVTSCLFALRLTSPSLVINCLFRLA